MHSGKKIFLWKWEARFHSQYIFVGLCSEAEILQDVNLHNWVCLEKGKVWSGALFEGLFHILEWKHAQKEC